MKDRCSNPSNKNFRDYGGRGIGYHPTWESFDCFFADMGERPAGTTLDRIDNAEGYSKANCRWATKREQARNRRSVPLYALGGFSLCITEWCMVFGRARDTAYDRIEKGWTVLDAVSLPPQPRGRKRANGVRSPKPAPLTDRRGNRRPRPRMTAKEFRAHQAARHSSAAAAV